MSNDPIHGEPIHQSGGKTKWLLGAAAAVVLIGGGYFAWQNFSTGWRSTPDDAQMADNAPYYTDAEPLRGPTDADQDIVAQEDIAPDESIAAPAPAAPRAAARRAPARAAPPVPEETVGVTPENITTAAGDSDEIVVTGVRRPIWVRTPSTRRLSALYPERALERGREGEASLHCTVLDGGALDCVRASETPGGFGNAALRVARGFRHSTTLADGSDAVGSPVNLRVVFRIEDEERRRGRG